MSALSSATEAVLLSLLKSDDRDAFAEIYNRYWKRLYLQASGALNSTDEGEEAVHDVFLKVWKLRHNLEIHKSLEHYLAVAVKYQVLNRLRLLNRRRSLMQQHIAQVKGDLVEETVECWFREKELMAELEMTVSKLPEKCQLVYRLSREQGYNNKQIAEQLDLSVNTVDTHLSRALRTLKLRFQKVIYSLKLFAVFFIFLQ